MHYDLIKIMESRSKGKKVVVCEGWDERGLRASYDLHKRGFAKIILLGDEKEISKTAKKIKIDMAGFELMDPKNHKLKEKFAQRLYEIRKEKGLTLEQAKKLIMDVNYFGCMLVDHSYADGVAGSLICPTADFLRPCLQILKKDMASEITVMYDKKNDRTLFISDQSMNINPNADELAQISLNAAECIRDFGIEPIIGIVSYSTKGSGGDGPELKIIREAIEIARKKDPALKIDGEFQVDAAVNPEAAKRKCHESPVAGKANTLIFPNLTSANIFGHSMLQFSDMDMEFTVIKGPSRPIAILGRTTPLSLVRNMMLSVAFQSK